jgi:hypothetical protein
MVHKLISMDGGLGIFIIKQIYKLTGQSKFGSLGFPVEMSGYAGLSMRMHTQSSISRIPSRVFEEKFPR